MQGGGPGGVGGQRRGGPGREVQRGGVPGRGGPGGGDPGESQAMHSGRKGAESRKVQLCVDGLLLEAEVLPPLVTSQRAEDHESV